MFGCQNFMYMLHNLKFKIPKSLFLFNFSAREFLEKTKVGRGNGKLSENLQTWI